MFRLLILCAIPRVKNSTLNMKQGPIVRSNGPRSTAPVDPDGKQCLKGRTENEQTSLVEDPQLC